MKPKGQKGVEKEERLVNTSRKREKRRKAHEASTVNFGLWNALCELSIYRENSQAKKWETLGTSNSSSTKISQLCTKIYHIEYKNI